MVALPPRQPTTIPLRPHQTVNGSIRLPRLERELARLPRHHARMAVEIMRPRLPDQPLDHRNQRRPEIPPPIRPREEMAATASSPDRPSLDDTQQTRP